MAADIRLAVHRTATAIPSNHVFSSQCRFFSFLLQPSLPKLRDDGDIYIQTMCTSCKLPSPSTHLLINLPTSRSTYGSFLACHHQGTGVFAAMLTFWIASVLALLLLAWALHFGRSAFIDKTDALKPTIGSDDDAEVETGLVDRPPVLPPLPAGAPALMSPSGQRMQPEEASSMVASINLKARSMKPFSSVLHHM